MKIKMSSANRSTLWLFLFFSCFFFFSSFSCALSAEEIACVENQCITKFDTGTMNWTTGIVRASGTAVPAKNEKPDIIAGAAKAQATKNLISILKQLDVSQNSVEESIASNDKLMAGIEKTATEAVIAEQYYTSDCAVEMVLETSIYGGFLQLVLPDHIRQIPEITPIKPNAAAAAKNSQSRSTVYTGLVLDARGLDFHPVIYPVIISENGEEIYSSLFISREYAVQHGVCKYLCSVEHAFTDERVGNNPLVMKGLRSGGENSASVILKNSDAQKIEKATERHSFLKRCKVIIVVDQ